MLARHLLSRRIPRLRVQSPLLRSRFQSDQHGPHKEYFQNPAQFPTEVVPGHNVRSNGSGTIPQSVLAAQYVQAPPPPSPAGAKRPSFIRRAIRNALLVNLFLFFGFVAGSVVVTWDYIQPPFEPDSEEYKELKDEIEDIVETSLMAEALRAQGWFEEPVIQKRLHTEGAGGRHLTDDTLSGVQGITMKLFRHPELGISALLFFAGFGIEGWPDVVHGGMLMSMITEACEKHMAPAVKRDGLRPSYDPAEVSSLGEFSFLQKVRPGEVYTIFTVAQRSGPVDNLNGDRRILSETLSFLLSDETLVSIDAAVIPASGGEQLKITIPYHPRNLHVVGTSKLTFMSDRVQQEEDETNESYQLRHSEEIMRVLKARQLEGQKEVADIRKRILNDESQSDDK